MERLIPLKDSKYIDELRQRIHEWKQIPSNRQLISSCDDKPMFVFAESCADNLNEILGTVFRYDYYPYDLTTRDFVCVDLNDNVIGYFHCIIAELPGGINSVSGVRTYRFSGSPYLYGKAQEEFYTWMYKSFDVITMIAIANSDFAEGKVTIDGNPVSPTAQEIYNRNKELHGFARPSGFKIVQKYNGRYDPYVGFAPDIDGNTRFFHIFRWLGERGVQKGLAIEPIVYDPRLIQALEDHGIYL